MSPLTTVIDTNVFVGALIRKEGVNRKVVKFCLQNKIYPLMGNALFAEYESLINRQEIVEKCPLNAEQREELLNAFLSACRWVSIYYLWRPNLIDEGDNHLVELAVAGNAQVIITNNIKDFIGEQMNLFNIKVLTPHEALTIIEE